VFFLCLIADYFCQKTKKEELQLSKGLINCKEYQWDTLKASGEEKLRSFLLALKEPIVIKGILSDPPPPVSFLCCCFS
jgi:hypothetical protein